MEEAFVVIKYPFEKFLLKNVRQRYTLGIRWLSALVAVPATCLVTAIQTGNAYFGIQN